MLDMFLRILNMSAAASVVIVVVLLARLLLRRAPKKWSYLLWSVVGFRLCCPVTLRSAFSVFRLTSLQPEAAAVNPAPTSAITFIPQLTAQRPVITPESAPPALLSPLPPSVTETMQEAVGTPIPAAQSTPTLAAILMGAWLMGMVLLLGCSIYRYVKMKRLVEDAVRVEDGVYETDRILSPFILGLLRPRIYLPAGLDGERLDYVLAHERYHLHRGDHVVKTAAFAMLLVHWFNPLVWLAFHLMGRDMEMSCDEKVLGTYENRAKEYSTTLLSFAAPGRFPAASPLCFGESDVKSRIKNALAWHKPRIWVTLAAAVLCLAAVTACAVNPGGRKLSFPDVPDEVTETAQAFYDAAKEGPDKAADYVYFLSDDHRQRFLEGPALTDYEITDIRKLSGNLYAVSKKLTVGTEGAGSGWHFIGKVEEGWRVMLNANSIPTYLTDDGTVDLTPYGDNNPNNLGLEPHMTVWNPQPVAVNVTPLTDQEGFRITGRTGENLDLTVTVPESWAGRYTYKIHDSGLTVYCRATWEEAEPMGRIFSLYFRSGWYPIDCPPISNERILASDGVYTAILGRPSDVQWTAATQEEYASLYADMDQVRFEMSPTMEKGTLNETNWIPGTVTLWRRFNGGSRSQPRICDPETSRAIAAILESKEYGGKVDMEPVGSTDVLVLYNGGVYRVDSGTETVYEPMEYRKATLADTELAQILAALRGETAE